MITPKLRLQCACQGQKTDRSPCICPGGMMNMATSELMDLFNIHMPEAHSDARKMADLAKAVFESQCFENYGVPFCMTVEAEALGGEVEMGNQICEPHVTGYVIDTVSDWPKLPAALPGEGRKGVVLEAIRLLQEETADIPIIGNLTGPVSLATSVMDPVIFYKELRKKNQEAHRYMNFITNQLLAFGKAQIEAGADIIAIADPSGTGEILGPQLFKEFVVTYLNKLLDGLKELNAEVIVHICGSMRFVYQEVNEVRSKVLSFDSVVSMREAKKYLGDHVLMGNVSTYALEFSDPDRLKNLTRRCLENGSRIISPACGLGMKSPLKNIQALLQGVKEEM